MMLLTQCTIGLWQSVIFRSEIGNLVRHHCPHCQWQTIAVWLPAFVYFMSSILACGPFLHLLSHLGYRKRNSRSTSSMPPDGTPFTPTWPRDLISRRPSLHNFLFRHWRWSCKFAAPNFLLQDGSWESGETPPMAFFSYNHTFIYYIASAHVLLEQIPFFCFAKKGIVCPAILFVLDVA
jgi:hypothetical protein